MDAAAFYTGIGVTREYGNKHGFQHIHDGMLYNAVTIGQYGYHPFLSFHDRTVSVWGSFVALGNKLLIDIGYVLIVVPVELNDTRLFGFSPSGDGVSQQEVVYAAHLIV